MVGLEKAPLHGDMQFEREVRLNYTGNRAYNDSLNEEYFGTILPQGTRVKSLLRLSLLGKTTHSSPLAREAVQQAENTYNNRVMMLEADYKERKKGFEDARAEVPEEVLILKPQVKRYFELQAQSCSALKFCYPMFAIHHMEPGVRVENGNGSYYCPCGRACEYWRENVVCCRAVDWPRYSRSDWGDFDLDSTRTENEGSSCNSGFNTLIELVNHLESRPGPMHQSAAKYLRTVYFTLFAPIPPGTPLHDVDNRTVVLKGEDRAHDVYLKQEPFAEDERSEESEVEDDVVEVFVPEEGQDEKDGEEEKDGKKPRASKKPRVHNSEEEKETAETGERGE